MTQDCRPDWYPDWAGQTIVVVASGPSAAAVPLASARGQARFIAVKTSLDLCPWAEALYACDYLWWDQNAGVPEFSGLKVTINRRASEAWNLRLLRCGIGTSAMEFGELGRVAWGGNSGFNAVNFAAQLAPAKILLVGFDMTLARGVRWHRDHPGGLTPGPHIVDRWRRCLDAAAPALVACGIRVLNCSPDSALEGYEKMEFEAALRAPSLYP